MANVLEILKAMLLDANSTDPESLKMILVTSVAVFVGCVFLFLWRFSSSSSSGNTLGKKIEPLKPLIVKKDADEVDDGKKKVTIFFGTQTGTAEGFAKVRTPFLFSSCFFFWPPPLFMKGNVKVVPFA